MSKIPLKRVFKISLLVWTGIFVLFVVGAIRKLLPMKVFGIPLLAVLAAAFLLFLAAWILYFRHLMKCEEEGRSAFGLFLIGTVHRYRFLIEQLVSRDFKIKYKRSVLGIFWSFLNPLLMMLVQYVVFSHLLNIRGDVRHYAIYLLSGIVIWNGFNDCSTQAMRSITGNATLITKVYVPKYIYPVTKVCSAFINTLLSMIPLLLVTAVYGLFSDPHLFLNETVLLLPFGLFFLLIFNIGMGFLLSSLMVFFHDVEFLWGVFSTIWMYATPIIYSLSMFESRAGWLVTLMQFNPLYHYISFFRTVILDGASPAFAEYGICALCSALMFTLGFIVFKKTQDRFVLYL
ncbi:MAG: ABC transporter permease [Lachnospiraceae bacterium]|nr:ABC transporter permease [Lachnospiraceae bacterium]